jgi:hypothetical protein
MTNHGEPSISVFKTKPVQIGRSGTTGSAGSHGKRGCFSDTLA